jgi:DNA-binding beta-propeller fold protein YncE
MDSATGTIVVALRRPGALALADREGRVLGRVELDAGARHLALAGPGGPVLVPEERADRLATVDLPGGNLTTAVPVGAHPHDVAAAGHRFFVTDEFADTVSVVEGGRVIKVLPAPVQPGGVAASGGLVGVVGVRGRRLQVYDAVSLRPVASLGAGAGPTHIVADGRRFYVADTNGGAVLVYGLRPRVGLLARVPAPGKPYGMAVDGDRLWVSLTQDNALLVFDTRPAVPRRIGRLPTVRQPNSLAVDAATGRVYVAGKTDGVLQIIEGASAAGEPGELLSSGLTFLEQ